MKKKHKKIKKIIRIKKRPLLFSFEEDSILLDNKLINIKLFILSIMIFAFVLVKMTVFNPIEVLSLSIVNDLKEKKNLIQIGETIKVSLEKKKKEFELSFNEKKKSFFDIKESDKFFDLIANTALINQLKIKSIKKLKEDSYKEAKPIPQDAGPQYKIEYDVYENYVQSSFVINFEGNFKDYISFIYDIKNSNKGLLTETSKITKNVNGNLKILSTLTINFVNNS